MSVLNGLRADVYYVNSQCPWRPQEGVGLVCGARVTDGYEPPCRCWGLNSGPLQEQQVFLTIELCFPDYFKNQQF